MRNHELAVFTLLILSTGCAQLMGKLRRDFDDSPPAEEPVASAPTTGGRWTERGLLNDPAVGPGEERFANLNHFERSPASDNMVNDPGPGSWITPEQADQNKRDQLREVSAPVAGDIVSSANTPNLDPGVKRQYKNGLRATKSDFMDESPNEGSLWASDGQTNYYFTKNKVRGVGDIITVNLEPEIVRDMSTEIKRTLAPKERDHELALIQDRLRDQVFNSLPTDETPKTDTVATNAAAPNRSPAASPSDAPQPQQQPVAPPVSTGPKAMPTPFAATGGNIIYRVGDNGKDIPVPMATVNDIDIGKLIEIKPGETMLSEIVERFPNGNYKIRGTKKIPYKNGPPRVVSVVAIAKGSDITEEDVIPSGKLYEYRVESVR